MCLRCLLKKYHKRSPRAWAHGRCRQLTQLLLFADNQLVAPAKFTVVIKPRFNNCGGLQFDKRLVFNTTNTFQR